MLFKFRITEQLVASLTIVIVASASADIINVPGEAATIQVGVNLAHDGDEVVVANGTYSGAGNFNINFIGKLITVRSASGDPNLCIIDCLGNGRGFLIVSGETNAAVVDGFTIINGNAPSDFGGGIYIQSSDPTIRNCIFDNCNAGFDGGGIWVLNGTPSITDCLFRSCFATEFGAGLYVMSGDPVIADCTFVDNLANFGGGMYLRNCDSSVTGCVFDNNVARDDGGALFSSFGSPSIDDCLVINNSTIEGNGGGFALNASNALVTNCTFNNNFAVGVFPFGNGGALLSRNSNTPCIENCTFDGNIADDRGGAMYLDFGTNVDVIGCTFTNSSAFRGGAISTLDSVITVADSYFESNSTTTQNGGAIWALNGETYVFRSTFFDNHATGRGGAISQSGATGGSMCEIIDCKFLGNTSDTEGGAVSVWHIISNVTTIVNSIFSGNTAVCEGGGLFTFGENVDLTIDNCSFTNNEATSGGAINSFFFGPLVKIYNTICWGNTPDEIIGTSNTIVRWCDIGGGLDGSVIDGGGNIDVDPNFVDADGIDNIPGTEDDDLHLAGKTQCIDSGNNNLVPIGITTDLDGNPRFVDDPATIDTGEGPGPIVDMGAYEFQAESPCPWDLDGSGTVGTSDLLALFAQWGTDGSADFDDDGTVGTSDLLILFANWGLCE